MESHMRRFLLATALIAAPLFATSARAAIVDYKATMTTASEVPPKTTAGHGDAMFAFDTATRTLTYVVTYSDLTGPATMGHIHGPAAVGVNAAVLVPFANPASPITGSVTLTPEQVGFLTSGRLYVNVHTAANPGGEIRGQITR